MHIDLQLLQSVGIYLLIGLGVLNRCWPAIRAAASVGKGLTKGAWHAFLTGGISRDRIANWAFLVGVLLLVWTWAGGAEPGPEPHRTEASQRLATAHREYERLCRQAAGKAAQLITQGDLTTDKQVRDFQSEANAAARSAAFMPVKEAEQALLGEGRWTAEAHAKLLKDYADAR
jgi:hypothetical protein